MVSFIKELCNELNGRNNVQKLKYRIRNYNDVKFYAFVFCFVKETDGNNTEESAHEDDYTLTMEKALEHLKQEDDEDFEISLIQKFGRENSKNDSSENDVDGDLPDVLTPPYIPTMMEHCFIMYNHDVYCPSVKITWKF